MKRLLIVIDYQKDFIDGALGFPGASGLSGKILGKIRLYDSRGDEIVYTMDTHDSNYLETTEGKHLPVPHCIKGTDGWSLYPEIAEALTGKASFEKNTFGSSELFQYLQENQFDSIELCGLVSNICVLANAVLAKTACPDGMILVDAQCTASFDEQMHQKTLDVLEGLHVTVIRSWETGIIDRFEGETAVIETDRGNVELSLSSGHGLHEGDSIRFYTSNGITAIEPQPEETQKRAQHIQGMMDRLFSKGSK